MVLAVRAKIRSKITASTRAEWIERRERGTRAALPIMAFLSSRLGRPVNRILLYGIVAYFCLFAPTVRRRMLQHFRRTRSPEVEPQMLQFPRRGRRAPLSSAIVAAALIVAAPSGRAGAADADDGLVQLMQQLAQRQHRHADFVERQFIAILDRPLEASGELFYDAPDHLEKRTLTPRSESLILDHGELSILRGKHTYALRLRDYPQIAPLVDSIRATLAGDLPALNRTYSLTFASSVDGWTLALVPRDAKLAGVIAKIRISGASDMIRVVEIQRAGGDHSVMTISALPDS
jgi:hypothetical protein